MQGQLPLQAHALGEAGRFDRPEIALQAVGVVDLLLDGVSRGVVEAVVGVVQTHVRGEDRVLGHQVAEVRLDQVPEPAVERAGDWFGLGSRETELCHLSLRGSG